MEISVARKRLEEMRADLDRTVSGTAWVNTTLSGAAARRRATLART